jgi:ribonuclease T1
MPLIAVFCRLLLAAFFGLLVVSAPAHAREASPLESVSLAELPREAQATLYLIQQGGPFPYPHKDGSIFGNFERRLPMQARGYYREYTVPTPGRRDRGARRIIAGKVSRGEYYYTDDHYRSFRRIREQP